MAKPQATTRNKHSRMVCNQGSDAKGRKLKVDVGVSMRPICPDSIAAILPTKAKRP